jgi:uncharacterized protein
VNKEPFVPNTRLSIVFIALAAVCTASFAQDLDGPTSGASQPEQIDQPGEPEQPDPEAALKNPDGSWKYTNRLIDSSSPYLLQHAHNPVDWYAWGEEAFAAARAQDKPIFLSVGYSTCYWCHVMEREVFSNPEIAALMNDLFINIKVDREQRPDLDKIYMTATQLMTGRGGWPNSIFMTPDRKPFYAGTYFGPEDLPGPPGQPGQPGFPTIIQALSDAWHNEREAVTGAADQLSAAIVDALTSQSRAPDAIDAADAPALTHAISDMALAQLARSYDPTNGGFGTAPKFPSAFTFAFLFEVADRTGDPSARDMALNTLRHMASGGIRDHVGGGFHRYSTDGSWQVPHFEKMLYNQAQIARAYVQAYEITGDASFAQAARDIFRYVDRRMSDPSGLFYSALDAETDAVEGAYYVWNRTQIESLLSDEQRALFDKVFVIAEVPIFPGHKHPDGGVLAMYQPLDELAQSLEMTPGELAASLAPMLATLEEAREPRKLPRLDDKAIVSWNGLMIDAYAYAGRVLGDEAYTARAAKAADAILSTMRTESGTLKRIWRVGETSQDAFLEDYAFLAQAMLTLHRTTEDPRYLDAAIALTESANDLFWDAESEGYYFASASEDLLARSKSASDGALPSGNAVMAHVLLDLAQRTGDSSYSERADALMNAFADELAQIPAAHIHLVHALERSLADAPSQATQTPEAQAEPNDPPSTRVSARSLRDPDAFDSSAHVSFEAALAPSTIKQGQSFTVTLTLDIDPNWHVNANPASESYLIATTADVRSDLPLAVDAIAYPEGHEILLAADPISVYEAGATIEATCTLASDAPIGEATLRVIVTFQACDDGSCLAPAETILELPVQVIAG